MLSSSELSYFGTWLLLSPLLTYIVTTNESHLSVADDVALGHGFDYGHKCHWPKMLDWLANLLTITFCQPFSEVIETMFFKPKLLSKANT